MNGGDAVDGGGNFGFTRDWLPVRVQLAVLHLRVSRGVRLIVRLVLGVRVRVHRGGVLAELHHRRGRGRRGRRRGRVEVLWRTLVSQLVSGGWRAWGKRRGPHPGMRRPARDLRRGHVVGMDHPRGTVWVSMRVPRRRNHPGWVAVGNRKSRRHPWRRHPVGDWGHVVEGHGEAVRADHHGRHPRGQTRRRARRGAVLLARFGRGEAVAAQLPVDATAAATAAAAPTAPTAPTAPAAPAAVRTRAVEERIARGIRG